MDMLRFRGDYPGRTAFSSENLIRQLEGLFFPVFA
jgi:hypothetical protein